jgi:hypothetical protein
MGMLRDMRADKDTAVLACLFDKVFTIPSRNISVRNTFPERYCIRPATLLPYPFRNGLRPVALRPTFSDSLPFSVTTLLENYS